METDKPNYVLIYRSPQLQRLTGCSTVRDPKYGFRLNMRNVTYLRHRVKDGCVDFYSFSDDKWCIDVTVTDAALINADAFAKSVKGLKRSDIPAGSEGSEVIVWAGDSVVCYGPRDTNVTQRQGCSYEKIGGIVVWSDDNKKWRMYADKYENVVVRFTSAPAEEVMKLFVSKPVEIKKDV